MSIVFSLIIPVYNVELYIEKCLLSCLTQKNFSSEKYEIIIVNDGTPDNSIEIAKNTAEQFPNHNVKFIERVNGGLSAARNTGLKQATGKYVWFIDSDDWIAPEALCDLQMILGQEFDIEVVTFLHRTVYVDGRISKEVEMKDYQGSGFDFLEKNTFLSACLCVYSLELLKRNSLTFREGLLWEDSEFNLRAYSFVTRHYFFSKSLYFYFRRSGSITTAGASYKMINSWFIKIDNIYKFFNNKDVNPNHKNIINKHLASTLISAVAGFQDLPSIERKEFRKRITNNKKYYSSFFHKAKNIKLRIVGVLIIYLLPLAEKILHLLAKRAIKKGEGNI